MREISAESDDGAAREAPSLQRTIGPAQMALYGLGSMLGAGIYGLIGKAAGEAGNAVWLSFVVALVAALLTACSYASLGSRYPRAAGAAYVTERAYGFPPSHHRGAAPIRRYDANGTPSPSRPWPRWRRA